MSIHLLAVGGSLIMAAVAAAMVRPVGAGSPGGPIEPESMSGVISGPHSSSMLRASYASTSGSSAARSVVGSAAGNEDDDGEVVIPFADAPEAVRAAALALVAPAGPEAITQVEQEFEGGFVSYGVEYVINGTLWSADISVIGQVSDVEVETPGDDDE